MIRLPLVLTVVLFAACSSNANDPATPDGSVATDSGNNNDPDGNVTPEADAPMGNDIVPSESAALFAYLQANNYSEFGAEPAAHPSSGPHGTVRSFFNSSLDTSIRANATSHPIGSAVIKELSRDGTLIGWAVMVKTANAGAPADWYYYEVFSTTENNPVADGNGAAGCQGCHSAGTDYIRSPYPN